MYDDGKGRLSYQHSCERLQALGYLDPGDIPRSRGTVHNSMTTLGVSFVLTCVSEGDMEDMTLPQTFFGMSEVGPSLSRTLTSSESTLCWNDFHDVDFTDANLSKSDLRASSFSRTAFVRANLQDADLRRSTFDDCDFSQVVLRGAKLTRAQGTDLTLSETQRQEIDWQNSDGDEPPGG